MNKFLVVLLSLLVVLAASDLLPEEAAERFLKTFWKHWEIKDKDIFDEEYYGQRLSGKIPRVKAIDIFFNNKPQGEWMPHTAIFTDDGFLKIKFYAEKKMSTYYLVKPNKNIEGGYKFYRFVDV